MIKKLIKKRKIHLIILILIAMEIFYFSSISTFTQGKKILEIIPIIYHFTIFFLFSFFTFLAINKDIKINPSSIIFAIIISISYALLDEIHQIFVPFRDASFNDILIDNIGILSSTLIYIHINKNSKKIK